MGNIYELYYSYPTCIASGFIYELNYLYPAPSASGKHVLLSLVDTVSLNLATCFLSLEIFFTISRLTICRNSVVKYKYQPSKSLENALFSAFYLSKLFIVGNNSEALYESVRMMYQSFRIKIGRFSVLVRITPNYLKYLTSNLCQMAYPPASNAV